MIGSGVDKQVLTGANSTKALDDKAQEIQKIKSDYCKLHAEEENDEKGKFLECGAGGGFIARRDSDGASRVCW